MPTLYAKTSMSADGSLLYDGIRSSSPLLTDRLPAGNSGIMPSEIGAQLLNNIDLMNAFIPALLNGIAIRVVQSKYWEDPWVGLEKGKLNYGELTQEIFIKMSKPREYNPKQAENEVWKRDIPDVETAYHALNYKKWYKKTIQNEDLRSAFNSWDSLTRFIADIIQSMFTSANYDVNQTKRYMIARAVLNGWAGVTTIPVINSKANAEEAVAAGRTASLNMLELSPDYNRYQVPNYTPFEDQMIILNNKAAGTIDVSVLAADFNMDKAEFLTMHRLSVSSFGNLDTARLGKLFKDDPTYEEISTAELAELDNIPFIIVDRNWFQIYDYFNGVTNIFNPDGLNWNYDYHVWKVFGCSPFANIQVFSTQTPAVSGVTVSPSAVTVSVGQSAQLTANVTTTGFANQDVTWSSNSENVTVDQTGKVTVVKGTGTAKITATSNFDNTKKATSTVTIASA